MKNSFFLISITAIFLFSNTFLWTQHEKDAELQNKLEAALKDLKDVDQANIDQIEGESRYIRAFGYRPVTLISIFCYPNYMAAQLRYSM